MSNEIVIVDQQTAGGSESAGVDNSAPANRTDSRLTRAQIEQIRATDFDRYISEGLDKRLLAMTKEELGIAAPTDPMEPEISRELMEQSEAGRYLSRSWDRMGSFQHQLGRVQRDISGLVRSLGDDRHQRAFMARFDKALPEPVRLAMFDAITTIGESSYVTPVSAEDVKFFSKDAAGALLVKQWGSDAPTRIARIWKKFGYLESLITLDHVRAWFDQLSDSEARAVLEFASR
ncbi:hypothetical protein G6M87_10450 [Rhizobium rhizogenes]|uniref:hypothetical protein n=1 Tax=Rhizobium rhizogenes TaxID=359 RepID=UPI001572F01C|nr:hypothetical protein [Rhizobium rhizogenes]NTI22276.1 hypothetical protein [Rhizobium rhizogenes]QTG05867.1 hypothetical protein G6M87_10450 [Rhizobium rhizogenes]